MSHDPCALRVRPIDTVDVPHVVEAHLHHFPDGFFARLGAVFLRTYYGSYHRHPSAFTAVAEADGRPVGYLLASVDPGSQRRDIIREHGVELARVALLSIVARPALAAAFLRTRGLRYCRTLVKTMVASRRSISTVPAPGIGDTSSTRAAVLELLVVSPEHRGRGVAHLLVSELEAAAADAGCHGIALVTEACGDAASYYRNTGWTSQGSHRNPDGRELLTFRRPVLPTDRAVRREVP